MERIITWLKKNKKDIIIFFTLNIFSSFILFDFLKGHYATDTYNIMDVGYKDYAINWSLKDGRIVMYLIGIFFDATKLDIMYLVKASLIVSIIVSSIIIIVIKRIICKYSNNKGILFEIFAIIIGYCTIYNFMYIENLYFVECAVMSISILFYLLAAKVQVESNKYNFIKSTILTILGVICYQGTIGFYIIMCILFALMSNKDKVQNVLKHFIQASFITLIAIGLNILFVKLVCNALDLTQSRMGNIFNAFNNIKYICITLKNILIYNCGLFPPYLFLTILTVVTMTVIVYLVRNKQKKDIIKIIALILMGITCSSLTYVMSLTSFYTGRLRFVHGTLIGILYIFIYASYDFKKNKIINRILIIILLGYFILNISNYILITKEHQLVNQLEKIEVEKIDDYIRKYEDENDIKVSKIAVNTIEGNLNKTYYKDIKIKNVITYSATTCDWSVIGVINFYTQRDLQESQFRKEIVNEGIRYICIGDILYINTYVY